MRCKCDVSVQGMFSVIEIKVITLSPWGGGGGGGGGLPKAWQWNGNYRCSICTCMRIHCTCNLTLFHGVNIMFFIFMNKQASMVCCVDTTVLRCMCALLAGG